MNSVMHLSFDEIYQQHEGRIYYHIHQLRIKDPQQEFYQEGLCALWNACRTYRPGECPLDSYFNYTIRNRLIDLLRKKKREQHNDDIFFKEASERQESGNRCNKMNLPIDDDLAIPIHDADLWEQVESLLTENQWKWVKYHILKNMSIKDIAEREGVTVDAVKGWARQAKNKLKKDQVREILSDGLHDDEGRFIA